MRITIPRWAQFVLIPVAIFLVLYFCQLASHAIFVFLIVGHRGLAAESRGAGMGRIKVRAGLAVPVVYLAFVAVIVLFFIFLGPPLIRQFQRLFDAIPDWLDRSQRAAGRPAAWLAGNNVQVNLQLNTTDIVDWLQSNGAPSVGTLFSVGVSVVGMVVNLFLTVVVSFYMLIDGKRIFRFLCRLAPGDAAGQRRIRSRAADRFQPLRPRPGAAWGDCRLGLRAGHLDPELGRGRCVAGGRPVCPAVRVLGGGHRGHPLHRPVPGRRPAGHRRLLPLSRPPLCGHHRLSGDPAVGESYPGSQHRRAVRWGCIRCW